MSPICKQIKTEKRYILLLGATLLVLVGLYMYFVSATVMHVVVRQEVQKSIAERNSELALLESEYIAAQHAVSNHVATLPGFVETPDKIFITKGDTTLVVRDRLLP